MRTKNPVVIAKGLINIAHTSIALLIAKRIHRFFFVFLSHKKRKYTEPVLKAANGPSGNRIEAKCTSNERNVHKVAATRPADIPPYNRVIK